jgi:hypothetical protein
MMWLRRFVWMVATAMMLSCGSEFGDPVGPDAPYNGDANSCAVSIAFAPNEPFASASTMVRAVAMVNGAAGVISYHWDVLTQGQPLLFQNAQPDGSEIEFTAATAGVYQVLLRIDSSSICPAAEGLVNVTIQGANQAIYRLRFTPPAALGESKDQLLQVSGGADFFAGAVALDTSLQVQSTVTHNGTALPSYVRVSRNVGMPTASSIDVFTNAQGAWSARLGFDPHDLLIVPLALDVAPMLIRQWDNASSIALSNGSAITGQVLGPSGAPLPNARVVVRVDDVPSTVGVTRIDGKFTLYARPRAGAMSSITVSDPGGLPMLVASGVFDLAMPVTVRFDATIALRDVAGIVLKDSAGALLSDAEFALRATMGQAGSIAAGITVRARGDIIHAGATGTLGALPTMKVPRMVLDLAVMSATSIVPMQSVLPAVNPVEVRLPTATQLSSTIRLAGTGIANVELSAVPAVTSVLSALPPFTLRTRSDANGQWVTMVPANSLLDVTIRDPQRRIAPTSISGVMAIMDDVIATTALHIGGTVFSPGTTTPAAGVVVSVHCVACSPAQQAEPQDSTVTNANGKFDIAAPDPGAPSLMRTRRTVKAKPAQIK